MLLVTAGVPNYLALRFPLARLDSECGFVKLSAATDYNNDVAHIRTC